MLELKGEISYSYTTSRSEYGQELSQSIICYNVIQMNQKGILAA